MKNEYANGYHLSPIVDGHDWKAHGFWDSAECRVCGAVASNAEIASRSVNIPACKP